MGSLRNPAVELYQ